MLFIHLGRCTHASPHMTIDLKVSFPIGRGMAPLNGIPVLLGVPLESQLIPVMLLTTSNLKKISHGIGWGTQSSEGGSFLVVSKKGGRGARAP